MNYSKFSLITAQYLAKELELDQEKEEIMAYALENLLLGILGIAIVILVGFLFQAILPAIVAAFFGGMLRKLSGGVHFNTPSKCLITGAIVYGLLGIISLRITQTELVNFSTIYYLAPLLVSLLLVIVFSPVDSKAKPIRSLTFRKKLKIWASIFVIFSIIVVIFTNLRLIQVAIVLGILFQALTLLPVLNKK